jgi:putative transposase
VYQLTKLFVTHKSRDGTINSTIPAWTLDTPKDVRKGALWDLQAAYKAAFTNLRQGNIRRFNLGFRRKKTYPSLDIPSTALRYTDDRNLELYPKYKLGPIKISKKQRKRDHVDLTRDCRLSFRRDCWYISIPCVRTPKVVHPDSSVCALDPGGRTFQTLYSPDNTIKFQHNRDLLKRLRARIDHFQALRSKQLIRSCSFNRRRNRLSRRMEWAIDALHYAVIQDLKSYGHILLPTFDSQDMVQRNRLSKGAKRELLSLRHYAFKQRLLDSIALQPYSNVTIVTEEYTSQTCSRCGELSEPHGDRFHCRSCSLRIDRDLNAARNILLKHLVSI